MEVFNTHWGLWQKVISEDDFWYGVVDPDGVNCIILKSGAYTREVSKQ